MHILIVDDDHDTRCLLEKRIRAWGHHVESAKDGEEAWEKIGKSQFQIVLTDWLMPNVDGIQLCKRIRSATFPHYLYLILGTAKNTTHDLVKGLESGADDFISKPYNRHELEAKLHVGERIISLERTLHEQREQLQCALSKIEQDLQKASTVQRELLPKDNVLAPGIHYKWLFRPSDYIGGDIFHLSQIGEQEIALYMVDVAGHGLAAAMQSMIIQKFLAPSYPYDRPLLISLNLAQTFSPAMVARELNLRFSSDEDCTQYFTMIYGIIHMPSHQLRLVQAGHPQPILVTQNGEVQFLGAGGFAVGMFPEADYEDVSANLHKGDRLYLYSDGITECENLEGTQFGIERLTHVLRESHHTSLDNIIHSLESALMNWHGEKSFEDDVTLLGLEITE